MAVIDLNGVPLPVDSRVLRTGRVYIGLMTLICMAAVGLGLAAAHQETWSMLAALLGSVAVIAFVLHSPRLALVASFFVVNVAMTKFRVREATALLSGDIDVQIVFELACYAVILMVAVVNLLPFLLRRQGQTSPLNLIEVILGGYVLLAVASTMWAVDVRGTAIRALQLVTLYLLSLLGIRLLGPTRALRSVAGSVVLYVFSGALLAIMFPWASYTYVPGLFSWFAVHPGVAATFAATASIFLFAEVLFAGRPPGGYALRWLSIAALTAVVIASHERAAVFALVIGMLAVWGRKHWRPFVTVAVLCGTLIAIAVGTRAVGSQYGVQRASSDSGNPVAVYLLRGQTGEEFLGLTGRADLWTYVGSLVRAQPLLGYGFVASRSILLERFPWAGNAHNALFEALLNLGVVGTVLLGWVAARVTMSGLTKPVSSIPAEAVTEGAILGTFAFLIVGNLSAEGFAGTPSYVVFLFFIVSMAHGQLGFGRNSSTTPRGGSGGPGGSLDGLG